MRISDWSSDVCSSDLLACALASCRMKDGALTGLRKSGQRMVLVAADDGEVHARAIRDFGGFQLGQHATRSHAGGRAAIGPGDDFIGDILDMLEIGRAPD